MASKEIELHTAGGTSAVCTTGVCGTSIPPQPRRMDKYAAVDNRAIGPPADQQRSAATADDHVVIELSKHSSQQPCQSAGYVVEHADRSLHSQVIDTFYTCEAQGLKYNSKDLRYVRGE